MAASSKTSLAKFALNELAAITYNESWATETEAKTRAPLSGSLPAGGERVRRGGRFLIGHSEYPAPLIPSPRTAGRGLGSGVHLLVL